MRTIRTALALAFTLLFLAGIAYAEDKPEMLFFFSQDCDHCRNVKQEFLPGFLEQYGDVIDFKQLDIEVEANLDSLFALEDRVNVPEADKEYPAIYFLGSMVEGEMPIIMQLESMVEAFIANPDSLRKLNREVLARTPEPFGPAEVENSSSVYAAYFFKQGCKKCGRAKEIIDRLKKTYPMLTIDMMDIGEERSKLLSAALGIRSGLPENKLMSTPVIFIGDKYLLSEDISLRSVSALIDEYVDSGTKAFWRDIRDEDLDVIRDQIAGIFDGFTLIAIILAGLADGVNPCAFATILFFVSYLSMVGRKKREILIVGLCFSFAVFITYFVAGLGFLRIVKEMAHFDLLAKFIFGGTGILCIIFGFLSISDYFKAKKGNVSDMTLQLPKFLKKRIHATIRKKARMESYIAGALIAGFMVSVLEFACTGQVYLPAITLVVKQEGVSSMAVFYLFLYNLCFILPLLIVFAFVYFGMSSQVIAKKMESRTGTIKLILAVVFFTVGGLLFWTIL